MQRILSEQLPTVLFKDYNGYWRPLKNLYWSQSSEALVARHPNSSVDEIVSQYCPQCLTRYSGEEAHTQNNRCANCYQCPCCSGLLMFVKLSSKTQDSAGAIASGHAPTPAPAPTPTPTPTPAVQVLAPSTEEKSVTETETDGTTTEAAKEEAVVVEAPNCVLFCEMCMWQSDESDIIGLDKIDIGIIIKSRDSVTQASAFNSILNGYRDRDSGNAIKKLHSLSLQQQQLKQQHKNATKSDWTMENMEHSISRASDRFVASEVYVLKDKKGMMDNSITNHADVYFVTRDSELTDLGQRRQSENSQPVSFKNLIPERMELLSKRTVRCLQDVSNGKMNILVQPKTFPLEGDSSLKIQRGKWWVKDVSAVHEIPFVSIVKLPSLSALVNGEYSILHINLCNPKDFDVLVTFKGFDMTEDRSHPEYCASDRTSQKVEASSSFGKGSGYHNGHPQLSILIGAYEDELLKDIESEKSSDSSSQFKPDERSTTQSPPWLHTVSSNIAQIHIPVKLPSLSDVDLEKIKSILSGDSDDSGSLEDTAKASFSMELHLKCCIKVQTTGERNVNDDDTNAVELPMRIMWEMSNE